MKLPKLPRLTSGSTLINLAGTIVVVYLIVVLAETVHHNYQLGNQIDELNAQVNLLQAQKQELAYQIQYYQTASFQDREARSKLGLQAPGESVVIIPHSTTTDTSPTPAATPPAKPIAKKSHFELWLDFLSGRL
jgi:cell division protein FtsB